MFLNLCTFLKNPHKFSGATKTNILLQTLVVFFSPLNNERTIKHLSDCILEIAQRNI